MKEQILQSALSKFDDILAKALSLEASRLGSKEHRKQSKTSLSTSAEVNRISKSNRNSHSFSKGVCRDNNNNSSNRINRSVNRPRYQRYQQPNTSKIDYKKLGIDGLCLHCGRNNHSTRDYRLD